MAAVNLTAEGLAAGWRAVEVNSTGDEKAVAEAVAMYRRMLLAVLLRLLERSERDSSYGFLDMKVDLITGEDFAAADEIRGKGTIYGWIQGRGLEALAGHAQWLMRSDIAIPGLDRPSLTARIHTVARRAVEKLEHLRAGNGGHLSFMMRDGKAMTLRNGKLVPKQVSDNPGTNVSDLFYAKGLAAAAVMLGDASRFDEAKNLLRRVIADVRAGRFSSDQEQLDARNPVGVVEGRIGHGPRMLLVGAAALMVQLTCDREWVALGDEMIAAVLHRHVNLQMKGRPRRAV